MKYFDIETVVNSYMGFQDCMTNKSWGYLALLKGCRNSVNPLTPHEVELDIVSNFLENIFNLSEIKKEYITNRSLYVVFSNKWDEYFQDQGKYAPNIYDVAVWAYRRQSFPDDATKEDVLRIFAKEFNIPLSILERSFSTASKEIGFSESRYSETTLKSALSRAGVDVSKENIDAKKSAVVASPGEIGRGPFVQTLYAGLEITDYVIILQSDYTSLYGDNTNTRSQLSYSINSYRPYITAIKSKPFLLLAGISGTGKSRIVRELARACWEEGSEEYKAHKPRNFEMVQVKPNWHDSSELLGYVSRIGADKDGNGVTFIAGDFLKFIARAWEEPKVPYFLCLDEMNLAPVEQYFAEYLSVVESRKAKNDTETRKVEVVTDPILKVCYEEDAVGLKRPIGWYWDLVSELTSNKDVKDRFIKKGITIPQNLIVIGTVNMDETTFSFSRKVLDRAMTIEMNEVDLEGGLTERYERIGKLGTAELVGSVVEGVDVYSSNKEVCDTVITYLKVVNDQLKGTPFKIAYRTRNEFLLYVVNNLPYNKDKDGKNIEEDFVIARALDEITNMKILSRIEGDETKVSEKFLKGLSDAIKEQLEVVCKNLFQADESKKSYDSISLAKLDEMTKKLASGYTSFWS